ncbi:MAG: rod shape-determining protein MreD [Anaerovoracaceae bacterium]|nr:rod shape-determining protein MreD [Bacillota bacterium]MDY2670321.1 rod shape-determining protein MreD [Anaerovoracaceae bacterium]
MRRLITIIISLVCFLLQGNLMHYFSICGGIPNLLLALTLYYTIIDDYRFGLGCAVAFGFLQDVCYGQLSGSSALLYLAVGGLMLYLGRKVYADNKLVLLLLTALAVFVFSAGSWLIYIVFMQSDLSFLFVLKRVPGTVVWDYIVLFAADVIYNRRHRSQGFLMHLN